MLSGFLSLNAKSILPHARIKEFRCYEAKLTPLFLPLTSKFLYFQHEAGCSEQMLFPTDMGMGLKWFRNGLTFLTLVFVCVDQVEDVSVAVDLRVLRLD